MKGSRARDGKGVQGMRPRKREWRNAGPTTSPGRHMTATNTDSKNKSAILGRMAGKPKPRSRNTEKAIKFSGRSKETASRAIRSGPGVVIKTEDKESRARRDRYTDPS